MVNSYIFTIFAPAGVQPSIGGVATLIIYTKRSQYEIYAHTTIRKNQEIFDSPWMTTQETTRCRPALTLIGQSHWKALLFKNNYSRCSPFLEENAEMVRFVFYMHQCSWSCLFETNFLLKVKGYLRNTGCVALINERSFEVLIDSLSVNYLLVCHEITSQYPRPGQSFSLSSCGPISALGLLLRRDKFGNSNRCN